MTTPVRSSLGSGPPAGPTSVPSGDALTSTDGTLLTRDGKPIGPTWSLISGLKERSLNVVSLQLRSLGADRDPRFTAGRRRLERAMTSYERAVTVRLYGGASATPEAVALVKALLRCCDDRTLVGDLRGYFNGRHFAGASIPATYAAAAVRLLTATGSPSGDVEWKIGYGRRQR